MVQRQTPKSSAKPLKLGSGATSGLLGTQGNPRGSGVVLSKDLGQLELRSASLPSVLT